MKRFVLITTGLLFAAATQPFAIAASDNQNSASSSSPSPSASPAEKKRPVAVPGVIESYNPTSGTVVVRPKGSIALKLSTPEVGLIENSAGHRPLPAELQPGTPAMFYYGRVNGKSAIVRIVLAPVPTTAVQSAASPTPVRQGSSAATDGDITTQPPHNAATDGDITTQPPNNAATDGDITTQPPNNAATDGDMTTQPPNNAATDGDITTQPPNNAATDGDITTVPPSPGR